MQVFRPLPVSPTTHFTIFLHDLYLFSHVLTSSQLCLHSPLAVRSSSGPASESFIFFLPASIIFLKNEQRSKKKILLLCISSAFVRKTVCLWLAVAGWLWENLFWRWGCTWECVSFSCDSWCQMKNWARWKILTCLVGKCWFRKYCSKNGRPLPWEHVDAY